MLGPQLKTVWLKRLPTNPTHNDHSSGEPIVFEHALFWFGLFDRQQVGGLITWLTDDEAQPFSGSTF